MPIYYAKNHIDVYRIRAKMPDIHELSGRGNNHNLTMYINKQIVSLMDIHERETIVDVGCGDGTLLNLIVNSCSVSGWGVVPTNEEKSRLEQLYNKCEDMVFFSGLVQQLPFEDKCIDKVICNGVLILMESENDAKRAIAELSRIAKIDGLIWIGELPFTDESACKNYGQSVFRWLWHVLINQGIIVFFATVNDCDFSVLLWECFHYST